MSGATQDRAGLRPLTWALIVLSVAAILALGQEAGGLVALGLRPLVEWVGRLFH